MMTGVSRHSIIIIHKLDHAEQSIHASLPNWIKSIHASLLSLYIEEHRMVQTVMIDYYDLEVLEITVGPFAEINPSFDMIVHGIRVEACL